VKLRDIALAQAASEQLGRRDPSIGVGATLRVGLQAAVAEPELPNSRQPLAVVREPWTVDAHCGRELPVTSPQSAVGSDAA